MSRITPSLIVLAAAGLFASPALAADWGGGEDFRPAYPSDWESDNGDTLSFDIGLRYWYAYGSQDIGIAGSDFTSTDQSHIIEGHFRIEDGATSSYVKGLAGFAGLISGTYNTPGFVDEPMQGGTVGYAQGDFGWMPLGDDNFRLGGVVGYQYWRDSPDMGRASFVAATGGDSEVNSFDINSLRMGVTSKYDFGSMFDLTAELVAVPFGWVSGTFGAHDVANFPVNGVMYQKSSATTVSGRLWGGEAELLFGVHPTDNLTVRVGGRAWYLTGPVEATFSMSPVAPAVGASQAFVGNLDNFNLFRYGAIAEISYRF